MSQAKVDRYKEEKKNRKKTMAKEKRLHLLAVVCGWLVVIALAHSLLCRLCLPDTFDIIQRE